MIHKQDGMGSAVLFAEHRFVCDALRWTPQQIPVEFLYFGYFTHYDAVHIIEQSRDQMVETPTKQPKCKLSVVLIEMGLWSRPPGTSATRPVW